MPFANLPVSSFAGVSGSSTSNSISIHGNSPQFLQWKIEGIEVPNPTHFADLTGVGGGVITALSSQVMGNSGVCTDMSHLEKLCFLI